MPNKASIADSRKNIVSWRDIISGGIGGGFGGCGECNGKGGDLFGKKAADASTNPKCYATRLLAFIGSSASRSLT